MSNVLLGTFRGATLRAIGATGGSMILLGMQFCLRTAVTMQSNTNKIYLHRMEMPRKKVNAGSIAVQILFDSN